MGHSQLHLVLVLEAAEDRFYQLSTKHGVITKYYSHSEFSI